MFLSQDLQPASDGSDLWQMHQSDQTLPDSELV